MKKRLWMIICGAILILASVALSVLGALRIVYIIKTDPFEDTAKYIFKILGLVGMILLQIFGYGGGIALITLGIIFASKENKNDGKNEEKVVQEIPADSPEIESFSKENIQIKEKEILINDELIEMSNIENVFMKGNELRFKANSKDYVIQCENSSEAVILLSKIKQYSK